MVEVLGLCMQVASLWARGTVESLTPQKIRLQIVRGLRLTWRTTLGGLLWNPLMPLLAENGSTIVYRR